MRCNRQGELYACLGKPGAANPSSRAVAVCCASPAPRAHSEGFDQAADRSFVRGARSNSHVWSYKPPFYAIDEHFERAEGAILPVGQSSVDRIALYHYVLKCAATPLRVLVRVWQRTPVKLGAMSNKPA